ncbi:MAG: hypothetical protein II656_09880, partial [Ruminococcus sp.]|nr:hypothetical protein [Ruminococcus sp.]
MSFFIIVGRNGGYPCIPELSEQYETGSSPPFCDMMLRVENGNYPTLKMLPDVAPELFSLPYPDGLLRCDERFNNGYPFNAVVYEYAGMEQWAHSGCYSPGLVEVYTNGDGEI